MSSYTLDNQDLTYSGIKCTVTGNEVVDSAKVYDSDPSTQYVFDVKEYIVTSDGSNTTFALPLEAFKTATNWNNSFLKNSFKLLLNNRTPAITGLYVTQELPAGNLTNIVSGNNKATFTVQFNPETFNEKNTGSAPVFKLSLEDQTGNFFANKDRDVVQTITGTKQSDGIYKFTLDDPSLNNGTIYSISELTAHNNVLEHIPVTIANTLPKVTPTDKPSEFTIINEVNTLEDVSGTRMVKFTLNIGDDEDDFNYGAAQYVIKVGDKQETIGLDVSNKRILLNGTHGTAMNQDQIPVEGSVPNSSDYDVNDVSGTSWSISFKRAGELFKSVNDGDLFNIVTYLEGKTVDASNSPIGEFIEGEKSTKADVKMNYPLSAAADLVISEVKNTGDQVVKFELEQQLSKYFDSSAGLQSANVYAVDASDVATSVYNFKDDLKQQIDASGTDTIVAVNLAKTSLAGKYGKKLRMAIHAYETNMKTGSDNKLETTTSYVVSDCSPINVPTAGQVSFTNTTEASIPSGTLTWTDSSANEDKIRYHVLDKKTGVVVNKITDPSGDDQVATITNLSAGVIYRPSYVYLKKASTVEPYSTLIESGYIEGTEKFIDNSDFIGKTKPVITSVKYAFGENDCSSTDFTHIEVAGNSNGHSVKQFYLLTNSTSDEDVVKYRLVDTSDNELEDLSGHRLDQDLAEEAPTAFNVKLSMDASLAVFPLAKQMIFVAMDTNTTTDPVVFSTGSDGDAAQFGENYNKAKSAIDSYKTAYNTTKGAYEDLSGAVDSSMDDLNGLLDASGKLVAENTYNALVNTAVTAFATWHASDASHALAYTALNDASSVLNSFITNFHGPANSKTTSLTQGGDNSALNAWNDMTLVNGIITKTVDVAPNVTAKVTVDASGKVVYYLTEVQQNSNVPITISLTDLNTANILSTRIKEAFETAKSTASNNLTTTSATDNTNYTAFQNAVSARNSGYAPYETSYNNYSKLHDDIVNATTGWNTNLNPSLNNLATLKSNFENSYQLWYASKLHYDCSENAYETIGTDATNVAMYNTFVSDLGEDGGVKYRLYQSTPAKQQIIQEGEPDYTAITSNPNPPTGYPNTWPKP